MSTIKNLKVQNARMSNNISMVVVSFYPTLFLVDQVAYAGVLGFTKDHFAVGKWKVKNYKN
jgi:hypothetical protein